ncbi:MAG: hypothetical protein BWY91_02766 [bacterium ADurb.BinA028]|nr:MAG: hypothetical protein BWY91_02766 [bacterium ADurb.BinA028]
MATPSAAIARPMTWSRSAPVISATALTWPVFSAMRAMIAGRTTRTAAKEIVGAWRPTSSLPSAPVVVAGGKPSHGELATPSRLTRQCVVTLPAPASKLVIWPKPRSNSQDSTKPKTRLRKIEIRPRKPLSATAHTMAKVMTNRATHWSCGQ